MQNLLGSILVIKKNYSNFSKIFVLRQSKMAANQTKCSWLKRRSVIKCLVAENCKPCEIYRRISYVYREASFNNKKQMLKNGLNMGLPQRAWVKKTVHGFSGKEKVPVVVCSKESYGDSLLRYNSIHHY